MPSRIFRPVIVTCITCVLVSIATSARAEVCVTVNTARDTFTESEQESRPVPGRAAVHAGWRARRARGVRVAVFADACASSETRSSCPLMVPEAGARGLRSGWTICRRSTVEWYGRLSRDARWRGST